MSGHIGEQVHHTLSTVAPRKRPRQDSGFELDSGIGDNESGGGSASDNGETGDGRQGGSQKRARSEGHGEPEVSRDNISWPHSATSRSTSSHLNASSSTRHASGSSTTSIYLNSTETLREPSEEPFIPLPRVSSVFEVQRDRTNYVEGLAMGHASQDDIARSMAFDEQMDALRHSPPSIPSSPTTSPSRTVELAVETHVEPESSTSSEGTSPDSIGELEASESELRARSVGNSSGRLHTLADTASLHSRILHSPTSRATRPSLPPILLPSSGQDLSTTTNDTSYYIPPRLRLLRHRDQPRIQDRPASPSPRHGLELDQDRTLAETRVNHEVSNETSQDSSARSTAPPASISITMPPSQPVGARQAVVPSANTASVRNLHTVSRFRLLHDMHNPFEPFELDQASFTEFNMAEELPYLSLRSAASRRARRQPVPHQRDHSYVGRPAGSHDRSPQDNLDVRLGMTDIVENNRPMRQGNTDRTVRRDTGDTPWHNGGDHLPGSFWAGIFDDTDSERDTSPRRPFMFDGRRRTFDSERDVSSGQPRSIYGSFRADLRGHSSILDSTVRRAPGSYDSDHASHALSSSSSSSSTYSHGRSMSRSLLDPNLSFGMGSGAMNSRPSPSSTSSQEHGTANRPRVRQRSRTGSWFDEGNVEQDEGLLDLDRAAPGSERWRADGLTAFPSSFSTTEYTREDRSAPLGSYSHHIDNSTIQATQTRLPIADREHPDPPLHSTYDDRRDFDLADVPPRVRSPTPSSQETDVAALNLLDPRSDRPNRRRLSPISLPGLNFSPSGSRASDRPSVFDSNEPSIPTSSRFRPRRHVAQDTGFPSGSHAFPVDSMEGVIPESNARDSDSPSVSSRRYPSSQRFSADPPLLRIDPPPRPVEPRLSSWDVGADVGVPPRRLHSSSPLLFSPLLRRDSAIPDRNNSLPGVTIYSSRFSDAIHRSTRNQSDNAGPNPTLGQRLFTTDSDADERRPSLVTNLANPEQMTSNNSSEWSIPPHTLHGTGGSRTETFNELVRRRAARTEAQTRASRRPFSPETFFQSGYRLPRPSFLLQDEGPDGRLDRTRRSERTNNMILSGGTLTAGGNSIMNDSVSARRERLDRQRAALLLERPISNRYVFGDRPFSRQESSRHYDNLAPSPHVVRSRSVDEDRLIDDAGSSVRTRVSERGRQGLFPSRLDTFGTEIADESDGARERQELHNAIGRRSHDDELSTRRTFPNIDRTRHISPRDSMSIETTTRNLQRRLHESEAEVGRALRALDQWGELEGSGERDSDPAQSRMHRFGETLRRRRVPSMFSFPDPSMGQDLHASGSSSVNNVRQDRRSTSPATAATRLQTRQARFARAQGRFRELEAFGESRSRGGYTSRLDMFGGSRFASRYITRNLGDYMRDEDFDASYENLVRLAAAVGEAKPRGTPAHLLAAMPAGFYKDFATPGCETRCPICLDDYKDLDPVLRISDCDHWFHKECLRQWLSGENSCPICRRRIRGRAQQGPPDDAPGPSGSRRDNGSDDDTSGSRLGGPDRTESPELTLEELSSYAAGW